VKYVISVFQQHRTHAVTITPYGRRPVRMPPGGYQSTRHKVISSHSQLVTSQLVTHASHQKVNSSQAAQRKPHQYQIAVQRSRTVARSAFFSQRVVTSWNKLPDEVVNATSINMFKNRLYRCNEWGN